MDVVYHYTSEEGLRAILDSGYIEESQLGGPDAAFGTGVYLTTMPPSEGRKKISQNNYGEYLALQRETEGKVNRAIRLWIPEDKLERKTAKHDRDVVLHKGRVYLKDYKHETEKLGD